VSGSRPRRIRWSAVVVCLAFGACTLSACKEDQPRTLGNVASARFRTYDGPIRNDRKNPTMAQRTEDAKGGITAVELSRLAPIMTQSIELTRDGTYRLRAGPIDVSQFDPALFGVQPPTDAARTIRLVSPLVLEGDSVVFSVEVTGLHKTYPGFQVWVY
jgi:hypothetical protein